jgi:hypothetical protein
MTQTALQAEARAIGGSAGAFNEDLHAAFTALGIPQGQITERMNAQTGLTSGAFAKLLRDGLGALNLDFAAGPWNTGITFTRSTTATYTNSAGLIASAAIDAPRIDYDPVTLACKGLLIEEARTNLLIRSQEADSASWTKLATSITANAATAPDGTTTADYVYNDGTTGFHQDSQAVTGVLATSYVLSRYVKAAEHTRYRLAGLSSANWTVHPAGVFDLSAGSVVSSTGDKTATIESAGNGWYRVEIYGTCATATSIGLAGGPVPTGLTANSYNGTTYPGGVYVWGASLEQGSFSTSYIPTVASQVTRAADVAVMTGTNFSSWYNQSEGTFVVEFSSFASTYASTAHVFSTSAGAVGELAGVFRSAALGISIESYSAGVAQAGLSLGTNPINTTAKVAYGYEVNDFAASRDGAAVVTDASGVVSAPSQINIGARYDSARSLSGHIRSLRYFPTHLPNATLQAISA